MENFSKIFQKKYASIVLILICTAIFFTWIFFPYKTTTIGVVSLEYYYPQLMDEAKKWSEDAYLVEFTINMKEDDKSYEILNAYFQSDSENLEGLSVYIEPDYTLHSHKIRNENPIEPQKPLTKQEWKFDSQEAMNRFLANEDVQKSLRRWDVGSLSLRNYDQHTFWILQLIGANLYSGSKIYLLDPSTGSEQEFTR